MKLAELIKRFRVLAHDNVQPYFTEDEALTAWLNDAVSEAAIRGRLIHAANEPLVCEVTLTTNQSEYALHESLYELSRVWYAPTDGRGQCLALCSTETLDEHYHDDWRSMIGNPVFAVQKDTTIQIVPTPEYPAKLKLEGYRLPLTDMVLPDDAPEIHKAHHVYLIQWALHKAFSVPDTEFFDAERSAIALEDFENYFGLRPDSDLRRITREDKPHVAESFMP